MIAKLRPVWIPAAMLIALIPVLAGLGGWQLHRAEQKRALQGEYDQRANEAPLRIGQERVSADDARYRQVVARGYYEPTHQILIDNRVHHGAVGYYVVTPLHLEGGDMRILVNRGWVPLGASREQLPSIDTPEGLQTVQGTATIPLERRFTLGEKNSNNVNWQPVWPALDMKRYGASVPFMVQPVVVLLNADVPHGFAREWARLDAGIVVHQGYAFQWFALAALTLVILIIMVRRALRREKGELAG